jgi:hypothetical protein
MLQLRLEEAERNKRNTSNGSAAVDGPISGKIKEAQKIDEKHNNEITPR